jgi:hypothetical protein
MIDRGARSRQRPGTLGGAIVGLLAALVAVVVALSAPPVSVAGSTATSSVRAHARGAPPPAAADLPAWTGGVNLYRSGVFTTQASWLYCTAADVQIIRNMVEGTDDHRASAQTTYFDWMRTKNEYDLPLSAGVDPAGWTAGMRHFVDDRYRLVSSPSFGESLELAVERIRLTNMPVALAVSHGNHGWILNGFTATADPAVTSDFEITSVRVTGPLWGLQSKNGYDMKPNTKLTVEELRTYFTPWRYDPLRMIWDDTYVSIQPVPIPEAQVVTPAPRPAPTPAPAEASTPVIPTDSPGPRAAVAETGAAPSSSGGSAAPDAPDAEASGPEPGAVGIALLIALAIVVAIVAGATMFTGRWRRPIDRGPG